MRSRTNVSPDGDKGGTSRHGSARSPDAERRPGRAASTDHVDARPVAAAMRQLQAVTQERVASTRQPTLQALMHARAGLGGRHVAQRCLICENDDCKNGELCGKKDANALFATPQGPRGEKLHREDVSDADEVAIRAAFEAMRGERVAPVPSSPPESPLSSPPSSPPMKHQPANRNDEDD